MTYWSRPSRRPTRRDYISITMAGCTSCRSLDMRNTSTKSSAPLWMEKIFLQGLLSFGVLPRLLSLRNQGHHASLISTPNCRRTRERPGGVITPFLLRNRHRRRWLYASPESCRIRLMGAKARSRRDIPTPIAHACGARNSNATVSKGYSPPMTAQHS